MIYDGSLKLPEDDYQTNDFKLPFVFLGDNAFALKEFMMKPYPQQSLTADERIATIDTAELVDHVDENGNLTEGEWQKDITGNFF